MCLAIPGKIVSTTGEDFARLARVDFGGIVKEVNLAYVPEAQIGNYVMVHVGFAISVVNEAEASQVFEYLKQMDELGELGELSPGDEPSAGSGEGALPGAPTSSGQATQAAKKEQ